MKPKIMRGDEQIESSDGIGPISADENELNNSSFKNSENDNGEEAKAVLHAIDDAVACGGDNDDGHDALFSSVGEAEGPSPDEIEWEKIFHTYQNTLVSLSVTSVSAVALVLFFPKDEILYRVFPFYACIISFIGGFVSTKGFLDKIATAIIPRYYAIEHNVRTRLRLKKEKTSIAYDKYVRFVQTRKQLATRKIFGWDMQKTKSDMDNVLDSNIFDSSCGNGEEKNSETDIDRSPSERYDPNIPVHFRTKMGFDLCVTLPIFFLLLCMQLGITFLVQVMVEYFVRSRRGLYLWTPVVSVLQTWVLVCIQIYVAYLLAASMRVAKTVVGRRHTKRRKHLSNDMNIVSVVMQNLKRQFLAFLKFISSVTSVSNNFVKLIGNVVMNYSNNTIEQEPETRKGKTNFVRKAYTGIAAYAVPDKHIQAEKESAAVDVNVPVGNVVMNDSNNEIEQEPEIKKGKIRSVRKSFNGIAARVMPKKYVQAKNESGAVDINLP